MLLKKLEDTLICKQEEIQEIQLEEIFWNNDKEVVYVVDEKLHFSGIITAGDYLRHRSEDSGLVNNRCVVLEMCENIQDNAAKIFLNRPGIREIPVVNKAGELLSVICREDKEEIPKSDMKSVEEYVKCKGKRVVFVQELVEKHPEENEIFCVENNVRKRLLEFRGIKAYMMDELLSRARQFFLFGTILMNAQKKNIQVLYVKRPEYLKDNAYSQESLKRIKQKLSFVEMTKDAEKYERELKAVIGELYSKEYVKELCKIPPIICKQGKYVHADCKERLVNVMDGMRLTVNQPSEYSQSIHLFGRCGVFGYAVEDKDTISSKLQKLYHERQTADNGEGITRIVNHGLWGADAEKVLLRCHSEIETMKEKDKIIFYMSSEIEADFYLLKSMGMVFLDTTAYVHEKLNGEEWFYDKPGHMNAEGYRIVAEYIYDYLEKPKREEYNEIGKIGKNDDAVFKILSQKCHAECKEEKECKDIVDYVSSIKKILPGDYSDKDKTVGCIVMNCNPFTKGHQYLIDYARKRVDYLIVFIVQEDKSYFKFEDRYSLVKKGTVQWKNVYVVPSGNYILSAITFPEYFLKDQIQNVKIDMSEDVHIFAEQIAPELNISIRFVGTEPNDTVTRQYNKSMRDILPGYGIEVQEIERYCEGNAIVSASTVRKFIKEGCWSKIEKYVPEVTYQFLLKNYSKKDN